VTWGALEALPLIHRQWSHRVDESGRSRAL